MSKSRLHPAMVMVVWPVLMEPEHSTHPPLLDPGENLMVSLRGKKGGDSLADRIDSEEGYSSQGHQYDQ